MIKINLLPIRAARKREYVKQQLILFLVLLIAGVVAMYFWWSYYANEIESKKAQARQMEQQIEQYKKAIGEVEKYKGLEDKLKQRLAIIDGLIKGKTGPVRVLDRMSGLIPKQVWLTKWEDKGGQVVLEGESLSNKYVAQFVTALKEPMEARPEDATAAEAPADPTNPARAGLNFFSQIALMETEAVDDTTYGRAFVKFKIGMRVNYGI